jgi:hypothetical protein
MPSCGRREIGEAPVRPILPLEPRHREVRASHLTPRKQNKQANVLAPSRDAGGVSRATDPNELVAVLREVEKTARTEPRLAAEVAITGIVGLGVAGEASDGDQGELVLSQEHVPSLVRLARYAFDADRAFGGGYADRLPEELRDALMGEIVREDVKDGETEEVADWIGGIQEPDMADVAKWELIKELFGSYGAIEGFNRYPAGLLRSNSDIGQARQRFSVLEAQQARNL